MRPRAAAAGLALLLAAACTAPAPPRSEGTTSTAEAAAMSTCKPPEPPVPAETPATIDVVEEAYYCVFAHHYKGATVDAGQMLTDGFIALTQELSRSGRDLAAAVMPPLQGDRWKDWQAFEATFRKITDRLPDDVDEKLAVVTLEAMLASLSTNHTTWIHDDPPRHPDFHNGDMYSLGLLTNVTSLQAGNDLGGALGPLFVTTVLGGAAEKAGLRPGDVIEAVNGESPFVGGRLTSAIKQVYPRYPEARPVRLQLLREPTGRRWSVELRPGLFQPDLALLQGVTSKRLGDVAYLKVTGFAPQVADRIFRVLSRLGSQRPLKGLVLDMRGNTGGREEEVNRLLGAFARGKVTGHHCSPDGTCRPAKTDDSVAPLDLPLVVLTDRGCVSACEHFSSAAQALGVGKLVGTRTGGVVFGLPKPYLLGNGTLLQLPTTHHLGVHREEIDEVGVAPDVHLPLTAADVAAGRDPALDKALSLLGSSS
ncbi:S41 family peptidase [Nonomuraea sp. NPDC050663]|uniref:S41 family peptidase n=1 Tax=Nonomuraea sp. NPDC050663 TaxID=3364370 RepID=UPI0037B43722